MEERGRPTVMTAENIGKLEDAFSNGATDSEACFIAGIGTSAFYDYCKENPDFAERKEALKQMVKYQAKKNVAVAIRDGSLSLSQWFLEKRDEDFNPKNKTEHSGALILNTIDEFGNNATPQV
ncbi:MAG: hypothetical protein KGL39_14955 [Patescibacteria group bacterium]|nr:hypothetical protein [Patescibacteria group bacterium]